jgi:phosphoglycerate kinase
MGGLKMRDKLPVMTRLLPAAERVLVGGALAHAFFLARGIKVGRSAVDLEGVDDAARLLREWGEKIRLPSDVVVARGLRSNAAWRVTGADGIRASERVMDLGPETVRRYCEEIASAKMAVWNGPLGYCEREAFREGTFAVAHALAARSRHAVTVAGGGDTIPAVEAANTADRFTLLSTGGGAMLEFLAGEPMPGIKALEV